MLVDPLTKVVDDDVNDVDDGNDQDDDYDDGDDYNDDVQVQGLGLHSTLYIMWPGLLAASGALFLVARYELLFLFITRMNCIRSERKRNVWAQFGHASVALLHTTEKLSCFIDVLNIMMFLPSFPL